MRAGIPTPLVHLGAALACATLVTTGACAQDRVVTAAHFEGPTDRYPHGVLGDAIEYGQLVIQTRDDAGQGATVTVTLPQSRVFEDLEPRLWDVTGDDEPEIVVVESSATQGAQLAIYDGTGQKIAATPHIGTRNRWLAPIAAADLDGEGHIEIAYIDRPHLAKILRIWRFVDGNLTEIAQQSGFSNHQIGWDYILGGVKFCAGQMPTLIVPTGDWRAIAAVTWDASRITSTNLGPFSLDGLEQARSCP